MSLQIYILNLRCICCAKKKDLLSTYYDFHIDIES